MSAARLTELKKRRASLRRKLKRARQRLYSQRLAVEWSLRRTIPALETSLADIECALASSTPVRAEGGERDA